MRKVLYCLPLLFLLNGCNIIRPPAVLFAVSVDYSEYEKQGVFLSESNSVSFPYTPIGSISSVNFGGYKVADRKVKQSGDDVFNEVVRPGSTTTEFLGSSVKAVLDEMCKEAKKIGANAIINLKIKYISGLYKGIDRSGYEGTGMAIKK